MMYPCEAAGLELRHLLDIGLNFSTNEPIFKDMILVDLSQAMRLYLKTK